MANPTLRRRQLATRLRELRKDAGMSIEDAAQRLECSPAKISRIETGRRGVIPRDVRDLCLIYGADQAETESLMRMAREARQPGWWQTYDDPDFRLYIGLETEASAITVYDTCAVPGILQTAEYARAIIRAVLPEIDEGVLRERVETRMKRQGILRQASPPRHLVILDESVLHRPVGGAAVMRAQLERVVEWTRLPHVSVRVIPFSVGAHMGFNSAFTLLEMSDPGLSDIAYVESITRAEYLEKPSELAICREAAHRLTALALGPEASAARIAEVNRTYAG
ncbi:transcriptional regulator [Sphaerisporangium siamense]|uniref:Transcriptional regulator with XRE-family HTH domain n=1 Tax=Sphaerisporangium siamense TaxID=795645 RepID=A0A7W7DF37_9ACTN|nr:helix-turn-helix transcriptional regulator [Sphaerisporangium siamense]MBB4705704.1 transcriptional regulator with XRE-family HTH domain [Sphaerisporangium siamense]GII82910.1 transcriptional regulator [Sphaerisporangium siamense]